MRVIVYLTVVALFAGKSAPARLDKDRIVFVEEKSKHDDTIITPPVLPVIEHLERDPTTLLKEDNEVVPFKQGESSKDVSPRFGVNAGFGVVPTNDGGFSASFSHGFSGSQSNSQSGSHSLTVGPSPQGFHVSQTSSQASSFGSNQGFLGASLSGSQASSQSSSFTAGFQGVSSTSSGASSSSTGGNIFGQGFSNGNAQSQSASSSFNQGSSQLTSFPGDKSFPNGHATSGAFGNSQNSNGFSSGRRPSTEFQRQPLTVISGGRGPVGGFHRQPTDVRGQRGPSSKVVFPGPTNVKQRNPHSRPLLTGLVPPSQSRPQPFSRQPKRKTGTYQIIRIEV